MRALGSAMIISPNMAKLAVTPPMVGSSRTDMYGRPVFLKFAKAAQVLAICIREKMPSCILAPPDAENIITPHLLSDALSMSLVIFSPTTEPILPPMKSNSNTAAMAFVPFRSPSPHTTASFCGRAFCANLSLSLYRFVSLKSSISTGSSLVSNSVKLPSSKVSASLF